MGVYINMGMPFCCLVCPCSGTDNTDDGNEVWVCEASKLRQLTTEDKIEHRPEWCPLVPVPPHGRLGDLDRLAKEVKDMAKEFPPDSIGTERYRLFAEFIKTAPTIIPAEGGGKLMYDDLVKRLRSVKDGWQTEEESWMLQAADAIEELSRLLDGVMADNDSLCAKIEKMCNEPHWISVKEI